MTEITYSGMCLAAMFGSILYEHHRLKKEEARLREILQDLSAKARHETEPAPAAEAPAALAQETIKTIAC